MINSVCLPSSLIQPKTKEKRPPVQRGILTHRLERAISSIPTVVLIFDGDMAVTIITHLVKEIIRTAIVVAPSHFSDAAVVNASIATVFKDNFKVFFHRFTNVPTLPSVRMGTLVGPTGLQGFGPRPTVASGAPLDLAG